jgi:hypothetical protein
VKQSVSLWEENIKLKSIKMVQKGISKLLASIQQIASRCSQ